MPSAVARSCGTGFTEDGGERKPMSDDNQAEQKKTQELGDKAAIRMIACQLLQINVELNTAVRQLKERRKYRQLRSIMRRGGAGASVLAHEISEELDWLDFLNGDQTDTTPSPSNESQ